MAWVALLSDTDCDGTTFAAKRYAHADEAEADQLCCRVILEEDFVASERFAALDDFDKAYWHREGYASLGAIWKPWAEDDSIGIPALDHTAEDGLSDLVTHDVRALDGRCACCSRTDDGYEDPRDFE